MAPPLTLLFSHEEGALLLSVMTSYLVIVLTVFLLICVEYIFYGHCN